MGYIIHGAPGSGSGIVEAACAEIGVDYEVRDLDARADEHRGEAYRRLNPQRKLPTLELDSGELITETVAILITLDERHRQAGLLPPLASVERAQALRWMVFLATELYPLVEIIDYPERFAPAPDAKPLAERAEAIWRERWRLLEANVSGSPYCLASGFAATDLYVTKLGVWLEAAWRREHLPRVDGIIAAVRARPALRGVWARHIR